MSQVTAWKRCFKKWSTEETEVLLKAWEPLYRRRRGGAKDAWVPLYIRCRALVTEDWRAVAFAVNDYRAGTGRLDSCSTYVQCKHRVEHLKRQYIKGQAARMAWPFFSVLHAVWADEVSGRGAGAPAGDAGCTAAGAAGAYDGAAADEGAAGIADSGTAAVHGSGPSGNERAIAMVDARASAAAEEEGFPATAGDVGGTASVDARGGAFVHEDSRADAAIAVKSCRAADGVIRCRVRVKPLGCIYEKRDAVFGAAVDEEGGGAWDVSGGGGRGASEDGRRSAGEAARRGAPSVPPIPKRPRSGKPAAAASEARVSEPADATVADLSAEAMAAGGSVDAVVVMNLAKDVVKLAEIYKEVRMKTLDVEREKAAAAAGHAGAGHRA